jgi:hypothetical protein
VWTGGCLALLVHIVSAFQVHYGWDHRAALAATERQTLEQIGRAVGAGLYVNYLFAALWLADAAWWWTDPMSHRRRAMWIDVALHAFLIFIVFNGTVVFGRGPVRWLGLVVTGIGAWALVAAHAQGLRKRRQALS